MPFAQQLAAHKKTTVSGGQSAIALEALVSAAFILIGSKVGDLIGRKRAYVLGLLGHAIGVATSRGQLRRRCTPSSVPQLRLRQQSDHCWVGSSPRTSPGESVSCSKS
jgi:hypothetical protein